MDRVIDPAAAGVLLLYTGSPAAPQRNEVARYLKAFLMDPYVMALPYLLRSALVKGVIVPFRAGKSAARYRQIWTSGPSPLDGYTQRFMDGLRQRLPGSVLDKGTAYGTRRMEEAFSVLAAMPLERLVLFPLFPQYCDATHGTFKDRLAALLKGAAPLKDKLRVVRPFYDHPADIEALRQQREEPLKDFAPDHVVFSYHGLPLRQAHKPTLPGLPHYEGQCQATTALLAPALGLAPTAYTHAYQSNFGSDWLMPFTDRVLGELAQSGCKRVAVIAPSFVADCLETLEELDLESAALFKAAGGSSFLRLPALNDHQAWIDCAATLVDEAVPLSALC